MGWVCADMRDKPNPHGSEMVVASDLVADGAFVPTVGTESPAQSLDFVSDFEEESAFESPFESELDSDFFSPPLFADAPFLA